MSEQALTALEIDHLYAAFEMVYAGEEKLRRFRRLIEEHRALALRVKELERELNTPQTKDFTDAVRKEAAHQRVRWGTEHDAGKTPEDWLWLLGYLATKATAAARIAATYEVDLPELSAEQREKALHHTISSAAVCLNWHAHLSGADTRMRPGIDPPGGT